MSPTERSLAHARALGWTVGVVERRIPGKWITIDLFGCIDIVAAGGVRGVVGIQSTVGDRHAEHRAKAIAEPRLRAWLASGGVFLMWSWAKQGARGKRKLWKLREEELTLADLDVAELLR